MKQRGDSQATSTRTKGGRWIRSFGRVALSVAVLTVLLPAPSFADGGPTCKDTDFAILGGLGLCQHGIPGLLEVASNILAGLVGVVAVGGLVWAGIMYASADGSAEQVAKAKGMIRNVVVGLVVFAVMALALQWLIPGGPFCDPNANSGDRACCNKNPQKSGGATPTVPSCCDPKTQTASPTCPAGGN